MRWSGFGCCRNATIYEIRLTLFPYQEISNPWKLYIDEIKRTREFRQKKSSIVSDEGKGTNREFTAASRSHHFSQYVSVIKKEGYFGLISALLVMCVLRDAVRKLKSSFCRIKARKSKFNTCTTSGDLTLPTFAWHTQPTPPAEDFCQSWGNAMGGSMSAIAYFRRLLENVKYNRPFMRYRIATCVVVRASFFVSIV